MKIIIIVLLLLNGCANHSLLNSLASDKIIMTYKQIQLQEKLKEYKKESKILNEKLKIIEKNFKIGKRQYYKLKKKEKLMKKGIILLKVQMSFLKKQCKTRSW